MFRFVVKTRLRRYAASVGMLVAAVVLAACGSGSAPAGAATSGGGPANVTLNSEPNPPVANQEATLKVRLADAAGKGVPGARVNVSGKHTEMAHGTIDVSARDAGNGEYVVKLMPSMPGKWKFTVWADVGGANKKADFDLEVK